MRIFALLLGCSAALGETITVPSWTAAQLQPGETVNFMTIGPDGNIWATEQAKGQNLKINFADGSVTRYALPANTIPLQITAGPDGNLWFSGGQLQGGNPVSIIGRMTTAGAITIFNYSNPTAFILLSTGPIAGSPDGNVYVADPVSKKISIINAAASTSSLVKTDVSLPFDFPGIPSIASRQAGGIYVCAQTAKYCGALIGGQPNLISLPTTERPTGTSECGSSLCVATSGGRGSNSLFKVSYPQRIIGPYSFGVGYDIGRISCTDRLCLGAAGSTLAAMDLTSDPPTSYYVGSPPGVNTTDVRVFLPPQGTLSVIALAENTATHDSNIFIGFAATPNCVPPVHFGAPSSAVFIRVGQHESFVFGPSGAVAPVRYTYTGDLPEGWEIHDSSDARSISGFIGGTARVAGVYTFTVTATDARGCKDQAKITVTVYEPRSAAASFEDPLNLSGARH